MVTVGLLVYVRIGVNGGSSFESELLSRTKHCQVWGYDFTLSSFGDEINNPHSSDFSRFFAQPVQGFYSSDPLSPSSQDDHVGEEAGEMGKAQEGKGAREGKEYWNDAGRTLKQRAHFKSYGVAGKDVAPTSEAPPMYTIESLMKMNGAFCSMFFAFHFAYVSLPSPSSISLALRSPSHLPGGSVLWCHQHPYSPTFGFPHYSILSY